MIIQYHILFKTVLYTRQKNKTMIKKTPSNNGIECEYLILITFYFVITEILKYSRKYY